MQGQTGSGKQVSGSTAPGHCPFLDLLKLLSATTEDMWLRTDKIHYLLIPNLGKPEL